AISARMFCNSQSSWSMPWQDSSAWSGCRLASPGRAERRSCRLGLYFMVHDPSGEKLVSIDRLPVGRLGKWRTRSISPPSGSGGGLARQRVGGRRRGDVAVRQPVAAPPGPAQLEQQPCRLVLIHKRCALRSLSCPCPCVRGVSLAPLYWVARPRHLATGRST